MARARRRKARTGFWGFLSTVYTDRQRRRAAAKRKVDAAALAARKKAAQEARVQKLVDQKVAKATGQPRPRPQSIRDQVRANVNRGTTVTAAPAEELTIGGWTAAPAEELTLTARAHQIVAERRAQYEATQDMLRARGFAVDETEPTDQHRANEWGSAMLAAETEQLTGHRLNHPGRVPEQTISAEDYAGLSMPQRQEQLRKAGLCGAKTQDGTPCLRRGNCPVPSHRQART